MNDQDNARLATTLALLDMLEEETRARLIHELARRCEDAAVIDAWQVAMYHPDYDPPTDETLQAADRYLFELDVVTAREALALLAMEQLATLVMLLEDGCTPDDISESWQLSSVTEQ